MRLSGKTIYIMHYIAGLLLYVAVVSGDTGSNGYVYGGARGGNVGGVGQIQLDSHSQSQYNGLPSTLAQSMNSGSGTGVSINGQANSGVNVNYVNDNIPNQVITGNSNANSNANAATGQLNNNDNSNLANTNGLSVDGNSQIWGNGTGVSVSNSANSNVVRYPITTTTPCSTASLFCPTYCFPSGCRCSCPVYIDPEIAAEIAAAVAAGVPVAVATEIAIAVAFPDAAKSKRISHGNRRKSIQKSRSRELNTAKNAMVRSHGQQRSSLKNMAQISRQGNERMRLTRD